MSKLYYTTSPVRAKRFTEEDSKRDFFQFDWEIPGEVPKRITFPVYVNCSGARCLIIDTLQGPLKAMPGDWVVRRSDGQFYPIPDDEFRASHSEVK